MKRGRPKLHGTLTGYTTRRCRCKKCKEAMSMYLEIWRAANPNYMRDYRREYDRQYGKAANAS